MDCQSEEFCAFMVYKGLCIGTRHPYGFRIRRTIQYRPSLSGTVPGRPSSGVCVVRLQGRVKASRFIVAAGAIKVKVSMEGHMISYKGGNEDGVHHLELMRETWL